jgi:hypothetical protein
MERMLTAHKVNPATYQSRGRVGNRPGKLSKVFNIDSMSVQAQLQSGTECAVGILPSDAEHRVARLHCASVSHRLGKMADHVPLLSAGSQGKYFIRPQLRTPIPWRLGPLGTARYH